MADARSVKQISGNRARLQPRKHFTTPSISYQANLESRSIAVVSLFAGRAQDDPGAVSSDCGSIPGRWSPPRLPLRPTRRTMKASPVAGRSIRSAASQTVFRRLDVGRGSVPAMPSKYSRWMEARRWPASRAWTAASWPARSRCTCTLAKYANAIVPRSATAAACRSGSFPLRCRHRRERGGKHPRIGWKRVRHFSGHSAIAAFSRRHV